MGVAKMPMKFIRQLARFPLACSVPIHFNTKTAGFRCSGSQWNCTQLEWRGPGTALPTSADKNCYKITRHASSN